MEPRRRLKKLKSESQVASNGLIPKKQNLPSEKFSKSAEDEDDSLDDFISDRVEYDKGGPLTSSEESAHSTDEENVFRKKKKIRQSSSESCKSSESGEELNLSFSEHEKSSPKEVLVGKKALEAKRKQGLIPDKKVKKEKHASLEKKERSSEHKTVKKHKTHLEDSGKKNSNNKDPKKYVQFSEFSEKDRKKAEIVTKILQRWWYALDEWPPHDFDYTRLLMENKLRLVSKENWSIEALVDENGFEKVKEVPGYPGVFINNVGTVKDLRPEESCPSFNVLFTKSFKEVRELLVKALSNQIEQLKVQPRYDKDLLRDLTKELAFYQKQV